jgi:sulfite dehydrogenase (quinone) subunit SoeC
MHPAFSVLLLTTLIGAAQGLMLALVGLEAWTTLRGVELPTALLVAGSAVAVVLSVLGLLASFFHLGHPERAWRAMAGWRTSWLSREVIVLPAFIGMTGLYGLAHHMSYGATLWLGGLTVVLALALFVCTGMIYAAVRVIREWATPWTVVNFGLMGLASGLSVAAALAAVLTTPYAAGFAVGALLATLAAALTRAVALWRNARLKPASTLQSAIGVRHPKIVQKTQGSMGGSFNTREFFHGKPQDTVRRIFWSAVLGGFVLPVLMLAAGSSSAAALLTVVAVQYAGLLAERWIFFAQANHPQNLYYQSVA